ncbi:Mur ligase-like protein [Anaerobacterium chartisolvens]|uniref:Mur ligase-like protein n=1 Tax=Anaerobacterium chartisolvens TaxID=1297424 RepID=A0A369AQ50_9FIRM|nr:Mur ligase family protein [Anaerobacterium chartisolvens]RCX11163.1 Mur ligase-like protein [Anaerobacterium chartisolvens]
MLLAAITCNKDNSETANLINSFLVSTGKKISITDSKSLMEMSPSHIKEYIQQLSRNNFEYLIIKINPYYINKTLLDYIHFDIMILTEKADDLKRINYENYFYAIRSFFSLMDDKGTIIMNVDDNEALKFLKGFKHHIITYGFNSKASVTTSSVGNMGSEDSFMCCLQRTVSTKSGVVVEPQEYRIKLESNEFDSYNILAAAAFAIVNDIDLNNAGILEN